MVSPLQHPPAGAVAIVLTRGWVAWVDLQDAYLAQERWHISDGNGVFYAVRSERGLPRTARRKQIRMHREIAKPPDGMEVDHIEHQTDRRVVDNRRINLRVCSHSNNGRNQRKVKAGKSKFKGVTRTRNHWQSRITIDGQTLQLGCFRSEVEAAEAYDAAARRYHGVFARTNFPDKEKEKCL